MPSRMILEGGRDISLSLSPRSGLWFTRRPSPLNRCVAEALRGAKFPDRAAARTAFTETVAQCRAKARRQEARAGE